MRVRIITAEESAEIMKTQGIKKKGNIHWVK